MFGVIFQSFFCLIFHGLNFYEDHAQERVDASQELNHAKANLAALKTRKEIEDKYKEERKKRVEEREQNAD